MRKGFVLLLFVAGLYMYAYTQSGTMTLTFTAENNGQNVPLNSIFIENLTQGSDTTLYAPDSVLVLYYLTGINHYSTAGDMINISHIYPNPMQGRAEVSISLSSGTNVLMLVNDVTGRELFKREYILEEGQHSFICYPGSESTCFLTVKAGQQSQTLKMFNLHGHTKKSGGFELLYNGKHSGTGNHKSGTTKSNFQFVLGDELKYTGASSLGEAEITDTPENDETYTFQFGGGGVPCPGMETVTDFDANVYNTVLIGDQCWMAENLRTTTYKNGTPIPNAADAGAWSGLNSGAYVWYDNDVSWKESYGALYNWYATVDDNGLCPEGWHVPTDDEWSALSDYVGGTGYPFGAELKSCRQVDSPLGGECNTTEHPRWNAFSSNNGTDDYGFSILPGGVRFWYGSYSDMGSYGYYWSSTEYNGLYGWYRSWFYAHGLIEQNFYDKRSGFGVRCISD